jgi:hypothetical protein
MTALLPTHLTFDRPRSYPPAIEAASYNIRPELLIWTEERQLHYEHTN